MGNKASVAQNRSSIRSEGLPTLSRILTQHDNNDTIHDDYVLGEQIGQPGGIYIYDFLFIY